MPPRPEESTLWSCAEPLSRTAESTGSTISALKSFVRVLPGGRLEGPEYWFRPRALPRFSSRRFPVSYGGVTSPIGAGVLFGPEYGPAASPLAFVVGD